MVLLIYQNPKSATQSGRKNIGKWYAKFIEEDNVRYRENLMGWISANNTNSQLKYQFASKDLAIKFAQNHNYDYIIKEAAKTRIKPKSYSANFTKPIL